MTEMGIRLRFHSDFHVEQELFDLPVPRSNEVLVRISQSQISAGTEMNFFRLNPVDGPPANRLLGYMAAGRVIQVGERVTEYIAGDRVLTESHHQSHWLVDLSDQGATHAEGNYLQKIDDSISDAEAGFTILADVALHGIRRGAPQIDESAVVFGCGMVGQLTVQLARIAGAHPIVAVDLSDARLKLAVQGGATHVINSSTTDPVEAVKSITNGRGAEIVFQCAPAPELLQTAMEASAERGKVIMTASAPGIAHIGLQVELLRKELAIIGAYEIGIDQPHGYWPWTRGRNRLACLRLLASRQLQIDYLVSHVVDYTAAEAMFRMMARGGDDWMGISLDWESASNPAKIKTTV